MIRVRESGGTSRIVAIASRARSFDGNVAIVADAEHPTSSDYRGQ